MEEAVEQQFYAHSRRRCATERQKKANLYDRITGSRGILKAHLEKQVGSLGGRMHQLCCALCVWW